MGNNLLRDLSIKIKIAKLDQEKILLDLKFIKSLITTSNLIYCRLKTDKEKQKYLLKYLPTEKQYGELYGLYYFARQKFNLTDSQFRKAFSKKFYKRYEFIRYVMHYVPNILDSIAIQGPMSVMLCCIKERQRIESFRERVLKDIEKQTFNDTNKLF